MNRTGQFTLNKNPKDFPVFRYLFVPFILIVSLFGFFISSTAAPPRPVEDGAFQEILGREILVLDRLDQSRRNQLRIQKEKIAEQIRVLDQTRSERLQEALASSLFHAARKIGWKRAQTEGAIARTKENLARFQGERKALFQEKLGWAVLRAFRQNSFSDNAFQLTFRKDRVRLEETEKRTFSKLKERLALLTERKRNFPQEASEILREAGESALHSERAWEKGEQALMAGNLYRLENDLKWKRSSGDYINLANGIKSRMEGYSGVGGFVEYGLPSLLGLFVVMGWLAASVHYEIPPEGGIMPGPPIRKKNPLNHQLEEASDMQPTMNIFSWPQEAVWGNGASEETGYYAKKNNHHRVLVLTDKGVQQSNLLASLRKSLDEAGVQYQVNSQAQKDVPDKVVEEIFLKYRDMKIELILAVGGGSVIDTAKAVGILLSNGGTIKDYEGTDRIPNRLPSLYAVPTTAGGGSEASKFCLVLNTEKKKKMEIASSRVIPEMVFIDPLLTVSLPPDLTASSGMDALSNGIEAYFSTWANPLTDGKAIHSIQLISESLRTAVANGRNMGAREKMALAAFEAGMAFTNAHCGAVHALGHPLSGLFGVPEGIGSAILLPHVMRYNLNASMNRMVDVAEAMGEPVKGLSKRDAAEKAIQAVQTLILDIGLPTTLNQVGVKKEAISEMMKQAQADGFLEASPFILRPRDIERIYEEAFVEYPPPLFRTSPPASQSIH